ncbi:MAG TPA: PA2169 family four-helix-bundle protein [Candidatus Limnocylindrales bacterium]|nr:PA2169 family four-helix-bundle protein [Candidatus Limnocylindrales bacterium]
MNISHREAISVLNNLIETCKDGENGFQTAAEGIKDSQLKSLFNSYAQQRAQFASELQREVRRLGGQPEDSGSVTASIHRGWMNIKSAVTGEDKAAIISECERGEDVAVKTYKEALNANLPADIRVIVEQQYAKIQEAHDKIRSLEKATSFQK